MEDIVKDHASTLTHRRRDDKKNNRIIWEVGHGGREETCPKPLFLLGNAMTIKSDMSKLIVGIFDVIAHAPTYPNFSEHVEQSTAKTMVSNSKQHLDHPRVPQTVLSRVPVVHKNITYIKTYVANCVSRLATITIT